MKFLLIGPQERPTGRGDLDLFPNVKILQATDTNSLMDLLGTDSVNLVIIEYADWTDGLETLRQVKRERPGCPVMFTKTGGRSVTVKAMKRAEGKLAMTGTDNARV